MAECRVVTTEPSVVACLSMSGPYSQIPDGYGRLYGWVEQHGLQPTGMPTAVYLTSPAEVPESDARWELWAPVSGEPEDLDADDQDIRVKRVPETLVATTIHRGSYDTIDATYAALWEFVDAEGYTIAGPPMERYHSDPNTTPPEEYFTEVMVPLKKA